MWGVKREVDVVFVAVVFVAVVVLSLLIQFCGLMRNDRVAVFLRTRVCSYYLSSICIDFLVDSWCQIVGARSPESDITRGKWCMHSPLSSECILKG